MNRRQGRAREARQRIAFRAFASGLAVFALLGLTRVSLSARVAEAAIDADRLRHSIAEERLVTDELEIDRGVLIRPDRLATIAGASMSMAKPAELGFLQMGDGVGLASVPGDETDTSSLAPPDEGFSLRNVVVAVMDMAAGEAEVLLVGDVGLASSR